jgi:hypothetical protein
MKVALDSLGADTPIFDYLKVGDMVTYILDGRSMTVKVTERTAHQVVSYNWKFDVFTGMQLDPTLQPGANDWGVPPPVPLGYLVKD